LNLSHPVDTFAWLPRYRTTEEEPVTVLSTWSPLDGVLGVVAPLALAAAAGTALVVDLDPQGPGYPSGNTLAGLTRDGPRLDDLRPVRRGVAVLGNGGIDEDEAADVLAALAAGWSRLVLRMPPTAEPPERPGVVPVLPVTPGRLFAHDGPAVHQRGPWMPGQPLEGVVLPRPRAATVRSLLEGRRPGPSRWLRRWGDVWGYPWP
jgi:hypothetical protein